MIHFGAFRLLIAHARSYPGPPTHLKHQHKHRKLFSAWQIKGKSSVFGCLRGLAHWCTYGGMLRVARLWATVTSWYHKENNHDLQTATGMFLILASIGNLQKTKTSTSNHWAHERCSADLPTLNQTFDWSHTILPLWRWHIWQVSPHSTLMSAFPHINNFFWSLNEPRRSLHSGTKILHEWFIFLKSVVTLAVWLRGWSIWFRLKYLKNLWMDTKVCLWGMTMTLMTPWLFLAVNAV